MEGKVDWHAQLNKVKGTCEYSPMSSSSSIHADLFEVHWLHASVSGLIIKHLEVFGSLKELFEIDGWEPYIGELFAVVLCDDTIHGFVDAIFDFSKTRLHLRVEGV
jgi:hypothetical protein